MTPPTHGAAEPEIEECIKRFRGLLREMPRRDRATSMDTFVVQWGFYKRRVAQVAAECLIKLIPVIREVYYTDLSEDYAGRDIDLVIDIDPSIPNIFDREIEETLEAILSKLAEAAGIELHGHIVPGSLFEIHARGSLVASRTHMVLLARQDPSDA